MRPQYSFAVQVLLAKHPVYGFGNFVREASARFLLQDHIDLSGCLYSVSIVLINRFSRRLELQSSPVNSSSILNVCFPAISPPRVLAFRKIMNEDVEIKNIVEYIVSGFVFFYLFSIILYRRL